jgi:hypothetical protein
VHARVPPSRDNAPSAGALLERPLPGFVTERRDTAAPRARQARHRVNRQGQASLRAVAVGPPPPPSTPAVAPSAAPPPPVARTTRCGCHARFLAGSSLRKVVL